MKLIQTIIAFVSIYVFCFTIIGIFIVFKWLTYFKPGLEEFPIAQISVSPGIGNVHNYTLQQESQETAGSYIFSRRTLTSSTYLPAPATVLSATSEVIFVTFDKLTIPESLVPIGYSSLFRLAQVTNAAGDIIYEQKRSNIEQFLPMEQITFSFLATNQKQTYTVVVKDTELTVIK